MNGMSLIELLVALTLLSLIACGTGQYFVWMTSQSCANFFRSQAAAQKIIGNLQGDESDDTQTEKQVPRSERSNNDQPAKPTLPNQEEYG